MNSKWAFAILAGVLAVSAAGEKTKAVPADFFVDSRGAKESVDGARDASRNRNVPMMIVFGKDHCGGCEALEAGLLSNKKFMDYAEENLVVLKSHSGHDHGTMKVPDPNNKGKEIEVCAKFPGMTCNIHESLGQYVAGFVKTTHTAVPTTYFVNSTGQILFQTTGDFSYSQLMKEMEKIDKSMTGPRVTATDYKKYMKALELKKEGKTKEAQAIFASLQKKKNPDSFKKVLETEMASAPSTGK